MSLITAKDYSASRVESDLHLMLGGLLSADWRQALIARGLGWHFDVGAFSTPITGGGAGTILDLDQPELIIGVPTGWTLVPLRISVQCQTPLIAADADECEILLAADRTAAYANDGTVTTETPTNLRSDVTSGCPLNCRSAATADITDPVLGIELARAVVTGDVQGTAANALWGELSLVYEPEHPMFLVGPAGLYGYWGGTVATTGFAQVEFLAILSSLVTNLS